MGFTTMLKMVFTSALVLLVVGCSGFYWLFWSVGGAQPFGFDLAAVRQLATDTGPNRIHVEEVAMLGSPASVIVAGDPLGEERKIPIYSYQIRYRDTSIILDTALPKSLAESLGSSAFDEESYERMQQAMLKASHIVVTHEHADHMGGIFYHPQQAQLTNTLRLTQAQLAAPAPYAGLERNLLKAENFSGLDLTEPFALAPGVVLIPAAGHTPGSLMVYVHLDNGEEFLFVGDIAWHHRNIEVARPKARLASEWIIQEDYAAVNGQIQALAQLQAAEPQLHIVAGHDWQQVQALLSAGALKAQFSQ